MAKASLFDISLDKQSLLLRCLILALICVIGASQSDPRDHADPPNSAIFLTNAAFSTRLFSVLRYESVIHEVCFADLSPFSFWALVPLYF